MLSGTTCHENDKEKGVLAFEVLAGDSIAAGDDHGQVHILQPGSQDASQGPGLESVHKAWQANLW